MEREHPLSHEDKIIDDLNFEIERTKNRIADKKAKGFDTISDEEHLRSLELQLEGEKEKQK